jgi:hypothetical protein
MCKEFMIDGEYYCTLGSLRSKFGKPTIDKLLSEVKLCNDDDSCCLCDISPEALGTYLNVPVIFDGTIYYFGNDAKKRKSAATNDDFLISVC